MWRFLAIFLAAPVVLGSSLRKVSVFVEPSGEFTHRYVQSFPASFAPNELARATHREETFTVGWSFLEVLSNPQVAPLHQAHGAGLAEGLLTGEATRAFFYNSIGPEFCAGAQNELYCRDLERFGLENEKYIQEMAASHPADPFWQQAAFISAQIEGVRIGVNLDRGQGRSVAPARDLSWFDMFLLQADCDTGDILEHFFPGYLARKEGGMPYFSDHCSALVKWVPGRDLYFSHVTWDSYTTMTRIYKNYTLPLGGGLPGASIAFSSYPAYIHSSDDFYTVLPSRLFSQETTNSVYNKTLYSELVTPRSLLEYYRVMIANRLASSGQEWAQVFARENSGTYNNQYMIVDNKLFDPTATSLAPGLLWVLEQIPGLVESADVTPILEKNTYWASYNVPYFPNIYNISGYPAMAKEYPAANFFSWSECPRARIFRRDHGKVQDLKGMMQIMRYNQFQTDPLSRCPCEPLGCSARLAIAARSDLNPANGTYPIHNMAHRCDGALDAKISSFQLFPNSWSVSGPTDQDQPAFDWDTTGFDPKKYPRVGQPIRWSFPFIPISFPDILKK